MATQKRPRTRKSIAHVPSANADGSATDQENLELNNTFSFELKSNKQARNPSSKRSRSKSLGPGGLDALQEGTGNSRQSTITPKKSILKPTIPLSPLKEIPSRKPSGTQQSPKKSPRRNESQQSPARAKSPEKTENNIKDDEEATTSPSKVTEEPPEVALQDEEEAKAREERQKRKEEIQKQREARRKSLANRRVSFAPEATLHTWDVIYDANDNTASSDSTNSSRRASSISNAFDAGHEDEDLLSTPPDELEDGQDSPAHRRDSQQKKRRRRSSGVPQLEPRSPSDAGFSSPYSDSSAGNEDVTITSNADSDSGSTINSSDTASPMDIDDDATGKSVASYDSADGAHVDMALHQAAERAGTRMPTADENSEDDVSMELAGDEITEAFKPWARQGVMLNKENIDPSLLNANIGEDEDADMSMEMTSAVGGIVSQQGVKQRRVSRANDTLVVDATMDFTTPVGGIQPTLQQQNTDSQSAQDEDFSMDFTTALGGIQSKNVQEVGDAENDLATMQLLLEEQNGMIEAMQDDKDANMDITAAIGGLINYSPNLSQDNDQRGQQHTPDAFSEEGQTSAKGSLNNLVSPLRSNRPLRTRSSLSTSATGSPAPIQARGKSSDVLISPGRRHLNPQTPSKQLSPQAQKPSTPGKTPPLKSVTVRSPLPKNLFSAEKKDVARKSVSPTRKLFQSDKDGQQTPSVVLHPQVQTLKQTPTTLLGQGGLGSPKVAELLDRRASIGEQADVFAPESYQTRGVRFENPRELEAEVLREREIDEHKESIHHAMEREADNEPDRDATMTLKEAITSMTPKKSKLKGRKSLALGTAKGVLGKRPIELDENEDESTPQPVRGPENSPVKKIRLQAPPSLTETTGRPRTPRSRTSPIKSTLATTPRSQGRFKDVETMTESQNPIQSLQEKLSAQTDVKSVDDSKEKIHLQDFLNMTNIRFMELNTTKRRHTIAPSNKDDLLNDKHESADPQSREHEFEESVVAGACTIPMLELYQHACRELRKYISEGRGVVKEIEQDTYQENPALFSEYMAANPTQRIALDEMFKNMKTNARFQSKAMWYEWRMKLLEGLKDGLITVSNDLVKDESTISQQEQLIRSVHPSIIDEHTQLQAERDQWQAQANEIADCDQDVLRESREQLASVNQEISEKRKHLDSLRTQLQEMDDVIQEASEAKAELIAGIKDAQIAHDDYRGWSVAEVASLKDKVNAMEAATGWSVASASSTKLTLHYRSQLRLHFDLASFLPTAKEEDISSNSPISLTYIGENVCDSSSKLTTERRFFLQILQSQLQSLEQRRTHVKDLLRCVSSGWDISTALCQEARLLKKAGITECDILSDERMRVKAVILLPDVITKVHVGFEISASAVGTDLNVHTSVSVAVVYGEPYEEERMRHFLSTKISGSTVNTKRQGDWAEGVTDLKRRLIAQGPKR